MRKVKAQSQITRDRTPRIQSNVIPWEQSAFAGLYKDIPASKCPDVAVTRAVNMLLMGTHAEARPGSKAWSVANLPTDYYYVNGRKVLRDGYEAIKVGFLITKTQGIDFMASDVGKYFVWPYGKRDKIMEVVDASTIRVRRDDSRQAATVGYAARLVGCLNTKPQWHSQSAKLFFQLGDKVYYSDYTMASFTEVINRSAYSHPLSNSASTFSEMNEAMFLFNSAGVFKIVTDESKISMMRMNDALMQSEYEPFVDTSTDIFGRRYLYTLARIDGTITEDASLGGARIIKETGSVPVRTKATDPNAKVDYTESWWVSDIMDGQTGNGYSQGVIGGVAADLSDFKNIQEPLQGMAINVRKVPGVVGDVYRDVIVDIRSAMSHEEIAAIIQQEMRKVFSDICPHCSCYVTHGEEDSDLAPGPRFHFVADPIEGSIVNAVFGPSSGTTTVIRDIGSVLFLNCYNTPFYQFDTHVVKDESGVDMRLMSYDFDALTGDLPLRGYTHFRVYSTLNLADPITNPEFYVLNAEIPVAKASYGNLSPGGFIATSGTFSNHDIGSIIVFYKAGTLVSTRTITGFYDSHTVFLNGSGPTEFDCVAAIGSHATAIIDLATKAAKVVTIVNGSFAASDVGEFIFWHDGTMLQIEEVIDSKTVLVYETGDKSQGAIVCRVGYRSFNDVATDELLAYRRSDFPLQNRFWIPLPSSPVGKKAGGFLFTAPAGESKLYYSQVPYGNEYVTGHYRPDLQYHLFNDVITALAEFPNMMIVFCARSAHRVEPNAADSVDTPEVGESIAVIRGAAVVSDQIGISRVASIFVIDNATAVVFTSDGEVRLFNGYQFGENLASDSEGRPMIKNDLGKLQPEVAIGYDPLMGVILWATEVTY